MEVIVRIAIPTGSLKWEIANLDTIENVTRSEIQSDRTVGLAIKFHDYNFL